MADSWRLIGTVAVIWLLVMADNLVPLLLEGTDGPNQNTSAEPFGAVERVDLGVARYPANTKGDSPTQHHWWPMPAAPRYGVAYAHGDEAHSALLSDHANLARRYDYRPLSESRFTWQVPENCRGRAWGCVYSQVYKRSAEDLAPFVQRFKAHAAARGWNRTELAQWLLAFVQQIEYRLPDYYAFGLLPPALVVSQAWGDCDSKSLLLMQLLAEFGIDSRLVISSAHEHAMLGINVPSSGGGFEHRGRKYVWAETTAEGMPLGWRHPQMKSPDDWRVVRML